MTIISAAPWACGYDPVAITEVVADRVNVEGQIMARGEPLGGALFRIRVFQAGCQGDPILTLTELNPESDGSFREELWIVDPDPDTALLSCIEFVVTPLGVAGLETTTVTFDEVQFVRWLGRDPIDVPTVEIDIHVNVRAADSQDARLVAFPML